MDFSNFSNKQLKETEDYIDISDPYNNLLFILIHAELKERGVNE